MDSSSKYTNQDELPSAADNPFLTDQSAGYNALYSSNNVPGFGAHWDLDSFQDPHNQSTVYQHAEPNWQPTPMTTATPAQVSNFGIPPSNYGLPYPGSSASFDFPTFNPQTGQPFSTASYDASLNYGPGDLLDTRNFETPSIADFGRGGTQNGTVSPQVLQSYPNTYGTSVGVSTGFQVIISPPMFVGASTYRELTGNLVSTATGPWQLGSGKSISQPSSASGLCRWQDTDADTSA